MRLCQKSLHKQVKLPLSIVVVGAVVMVVGVDMEGTGGIVVVEAVC